MAHELRQCAPGIKQGPRGRPGTYCGRWLPATGEYFGVNSKGFMARRCRVCQRLVSHVVQGGPLRSSEDCWIRPCSDCGEPCYGERCRPCLRNRRTDPSVKRFRENHNFTVAQAEETLETQNGLCPCGEPLTLDEAQVDHDHACCSRNDRTSCGNCVRALTHPKCNRGFGMFGDDPVRMAKFAMFMLQREAA